VRLASEGANIVAIDICEQIESNPYPLSSSEDLAETARLVEKEGRSCVSVKADVRDLSQLNAAVKQGIDRLGKIDIVCANAGILPMGAGKGAQAYMDAFAVDRREACCSMGVTVCARELRPPNKLQHSSLAPS